MSKLVEDGILKRIGSKKEGYWKIADGYLNGYLNGYINCDNKNVKSLSDTENNILINISENQKISTSDLAKIVNVGTTTVTRTIKKLKELGLIERVGSKKNGYWKIIQ